MPRLRPRAAADILGQTQGGAAATFLLSRGVGLASINCFIVVAFLIIQGKLVIPEVRAEDGGFYICNVTSAASEHAASALLNVTGLVPRFGQSPVSYQTFPQLQDVFLNLELSVSFRPEAGAGLILYNGNTDPDTQDFISLGLASSVPELRYNLGSGVTVVRAQRPVR